MQPPGLRRRNSFLRIGKGALSGSSRSARPQSVRLLCVRSGATSSRATAPSNSTCFRMRGETASSKRTPHSSAPAHMTRQRTSSPPTRRRAVDPLGGSGDPRSFAPACEMSTSSGNWYALIVTTAAGSNTRARGARGCVRPRGGRDANAFIEGSNDALEVKACLRSRRNSIRNGAILIASPLPCARETGKRATKETAGEARMNWFLLGLKPARPRSPARPASRITKPGRFATMVEASRHIIPGSYRG